jgi:type I restriction enzyme R subunit
LLQAIARTNRPYPGKEAGIIVDYVGIFKRLIKALNFESQDVKDVAVDLEKLKDEFRAKMVAALKPFGGISREDTRDSLLAAIDVLRNEPTFAEFKQNLAALRKLYETIAPDPDLFAFLDDLAWLLEVNEAYNKIRNRGRSDLSEFEEKTKALIQDRLILQKLDATIPAFEINGEYLEKLEKAGLTKQQQIKDMLDALPIYIGRNMDRNPLFESLSKRLEKIVAIKNDPQLEGELRQLVRDTASVEEQAKIKGLTDEQFAIFMAVKTYFPDGAEADLIAFVRELCDHVKVGEHLFSGWQRKSFVVKEVQRTVFDEYFKKFKNVLGIEQLEQLSEKTEQLLERYN